MLHIPLAAADNWLEAAVESAVELELTKEREGGESQVSL